MSKTKKAAVDDTAIVMQQNRRNRGGGQGRVISPRIWQYLKGGADYAHHITITTAPHPDFQIVLRPCAVGSLPAICRKWVIKIPA